MPVALLKNLSNLFNGLANKLDSIIELISRDRNVDESGEFVETPVDERDFEIEF